MKQNNLKEEEIYFIAEQILLGEKTKEEFQFLNEDDPAKLNTLLYRGLAGLAKSRRDSLVRHTTHLDCNDAESHAKLTPQYIAQQKQQAKQQRTEMLYTLSRHIAFRIFPLDKLAQESEVIRRKGVEALMRHFSAQELAILFSPHKESDTAPLFKAMGVKLAEEISYHMEKLSEEDISYQFNFVAVKYSIIMVTDLKDQQALSKQMQEYIEQYMQRFATDLRKYCEQLPIRFKMLDRIEKFKPQHWTKLAGLTPRRDMAAFAKTLPEHVWKKLMEPLPYIQRDEVKELIELHEKKCEQQFIAFIDTIESLKRWNILIDKVIEDDKSYFAI